MSKRIVFTTKTPNDQGGIIPDDVIDFSRFNKNPVVLREHKWGDDPIGLWTDIKKGSDGWSGIPVFHGLTPESQRAKDLYEGGWMRAASIGGEAVWKTNAAGQYDLDKNGFRQCLKFILYEISIVTLPSNADAVQTDAIELSAKVYEAGELDNINRSITTLSSKFYNNMADKTATTETSTQSAAPAAPAATPAATAAATEPAAKPVEGEGRITLSANELPGFLEKIINGVKSVFTTDKNAAPAPKDTPDSTKVGKEIAEPQPTPTGLAAAEKAKEKAEAAREAAEKAVKKAEGAKKKADAEDASAADKDECKSCMEAAEKAMKAAEDAEAAYEKAKKGDEKDTNSAGASEITTNSSGMKPEKKTLEQLRADLKLAAPPTEAAAHQAKVLNTSNGRTFSQLAADKGEGRAILNRVMTRDAGEKHISDYAIVLNTIMNDGRLAALKEKVRFMMNVNEASLGSFQANPHTRAGIDLKTLAAQVNAGQIEMMGRDNVMRNITKLNSSDDALASPALTGIEWLPLAIFKLFPNTGWKNEIAIFAAQETGNNLGVIWANIAADPTIYKGTQPVNPASYTYSDTAVALKLTPYWLQPMLWTPLTMHMLRYDQMGTGWSQAFAKWGSVMDDNMLYTLASTVPAASIVSSSGLSGSATNADIFNIASSSDPNSFYYNPSFTGNLKKPVLNDLIVMEQIYNKQNFELDQEKAVLVMDPTMDRYIAQDPETKSLLTRWVNADGASLLAYKDTVLHKRSRVAIYDPATGQVKDPNGVIPATSVSAGISFIPSQVGMGLGMLDVFMIQDPTAYGYKMSADCRMGIVPLRASYDGTGLYTYGAGNI